MQLMIINRECRYNQLYRRFAQRKNFAVFNQKQDPRGNDYLLDAAR